MNRGLVLSKRNQHITYESSVINSSQENEQKPFFTKVILVTLTLDIKNTKSIGVKPSPGPIRVSNMTAL